jgi:hypothetical protein
MGIHIISGAGETATSAANGLTDLATRLQAAHANQTVRRWAWNEWSGIDEGFDDGQPVLLIGHSFGGCTAVMRSRQLAPMNIGVHLMLIDPVRHCRDDANFDVPLTDSLSAQVGGLPFEPGENWASAIAFLRGGIWYSPLTWPSCLPFHQGIDLKPEDAPRLNNLVVEAVDHNSICKSNLVIGSIFNKAAELFGCG